MKKYLLLFSIMVFSSLNIISQDVIDPRPLFSKDTLSVYDHRGNQFIFGWNWGGEGRKLDLALNMNTYHTLTHLVTGTGQDVTGYITEMGDSIKDIEWLGTPGFNWNDWRGLTGRIDTVATNGMSIFLEPTTIVDTSDHTFKSRWNDITAGVYGFKYQMNQRK